MHTVTTMESIISTIGDLVTAAVGWIGEFAGVISSTPILLIFVITGFVGLGVGLIKRLMSL